MHPLRLLALIGIALPVFAATPLSLHRGSTRDWVKRVGYSGDSVRYHLEFLDSTSRSTSSEYKASYIPPGGTVYVDKLVPRKALVTEWKVRVTIPDSPSVVDTAILRVVGVTIDYDVFKTGSNTRILNLAYWYKPSVHCPIDVQANPVTEVKRYLTLGVRDPLHLLPNGAWELLLMNRVPESKDLALNDDGTLSTRSLGSGFSGSIPMVSSMDGIGITSWLRNQAYWKLKAADGKALPAPPGGFGHRLKSGESWVYRDSSGNNIYPNLNRKAYVSLELLAPLSDSAGWTRLSVRKSVHPDTGDAKDTVLAIRVDTLRRMVRNGNDLITPWLVSSVTGVNWMLVSPSMEVEWALGLMDHPIFPDSTKSRYAIGGSSHEGEVPSSGISRSFQMNLVDSIGATSIWSASRSWGVMYNEPFSSWTLIAHSFDNTILPASARLPGKARNLAWLRERIAHDPSLEIVRITPDGSRTRARGPDAAKLLDGRGFGIVQVRDEQKLVTLRMIRP